LVELLYGSMYPEAVGMLRVLGLVPVFFALGAVGSGLMRAREQTYRELWVGVGASVLSVALGVPWMLEYGALGAAYALVASYAVFAIGRFAVLAWKPLPRAT
jgi:O-antigen/teichoic acid export membrane protein